MMNENLTEVHRILDEKAAKRVAKLFDDYIDEEYIPNQAKKKQEDCDIVEETVFEG
jgi:uncharacterized protein YlbG (UPF0298 family)